MSSCSPSSTIPGAANADLTKAEQAREIIAFAGPGADQPPAW